MERPPSGPCTDHCGLQKQVSPPENSHKVFPLERLIFSFLECDFMLIILDLFAYGYVGCVLAYEPGDAGSSPDPTILNFSEGSLNSGSVTGVTPPPPCSLAREKNPYYTVPST